MKNRILLLFIFITIKTSAQIPSHVPLNGLIGYWPINGNANDYSGNGLNGVVTGDRKSVV